MSRFLAASSLLALGAAAEGMNFNIYSWPVKLRYGQVHNFPHWMEAQPNYLPQDVIDRYASGEKEMAITGFDLDMVRKQADGTEVQVELSDHYLHHYILQFGQAKQLTKLFNTPKTHPHMAHLFKGCHAMKGAHVRAFRALLEEEAAVQGGPDPKDLNLVSYGGASGSEYRNNPQRFMEPYRLVLKKPEAWAPMLHIINTNIKDNTTGTPVDGVNRLVECPCTPQRKINVTNGTIDGQVAQPPIGCGKAFEATGNPSCHLATYSGGWRCCENGVFLIDTEKECATPDCSEKLVDEVYMKFTFYYEDVDTSTRYIEMSACCDVTSDIQGWENIEYDIPQCAPGTPPEQCIYVSESVQPVGHYGIRWNGTNIVDLVFACPHLHWSALSLELFDHATNEKLCEVHRTDDNSAGLIYGKGTGPGDEKDYLTGLTCCKWDTKTARRYQRNHPLRARAVYNATEHHTGVMALWLMQVSAVPTEGILV